MILEAYDFRFRRGILTSPSATVCNDNYRKLELPKNLHIPFARMNFTILPTGLPVLDRALFIRGYTPPSFANGLAVALASATRATTPTPAFSADSTAPLLFSFVCGLYIDNQAHVVLAWTDPPGNQAAQMQLVNDLDLVVVTPSAQVHLSCMFLSFSSKHFEQLRCCLN